MTDIENMEDVEEKKESWYAKLRASLKEKYEGQINDLQNQVEQLKSSHVATKRNFFERSLKQEGYEGDFSDFANKYQDLDVDEMVALYKWMNWAIKKEGSEEAPKEENNQLGSKSVLWTNPTATSQEESVDKMDGKAYLDYLKRNMWQLGLG
jgi:hypothetical protein